MDADGSNPAITVLRRDWKALANPWQIPIAGFSCVVGIVAFGWRFFPIAVAIMAVTSAVLTAIERAQFRCEVTPRLSYTLNATLGRRPGRLLVDDRGMKWWPYADRHGDPELVTTWTAVQRVEIEPVAAAMPRCRLHPSSPEPFDVPFEMSKGARKLRAVLNEVVGNRE